MDSEEYQIALIEAKWAPIPRIARTIPFGYEEDPSDPDILLPIAFELEVLERAKIHLKQYSLRDVARWMTETTGRYISHMGLKKRELTLSSLDKEKLAFLSSGPKATKRQGRKSRSSKKKDLAQEPTPTPTIIAPVNIIFDDVVDDTREVVFRPNPGPQTDFLTASEREVLYGGAAGGGKSYGVLVDAIGAGLANPRFRGLIVRRTMDELRELIQKSQELYPLAIPGIQWMEGRKEWVTPTGGRLWLSYLERDQDVTRYQGQSYNYIAFDELTQWPTSYCWDYMRSRLRTTKGSGLKLYMRATSNPGGLGHHWVKKMFIDPSPPGAAFWATDMDTGEVMVYPEYRIVAGRRIEHPNAGLPLFKRRFIPARLSDNPYLYDEGDYEIQLLSLPEAERKRLLEGDWDVSEGAAFPEWNRHIHVIKPFEIPWDWRRFRSCDYGYGSFSSVLWFAIAPSDQLIVYRELYVSKVLAKDLAIKILEIERNENVSYGVLDSSCWYQRGDTGPSIAETMIAEGCRWRPSDRSKGSRVAGKNEVHRRLQIDENTNEPRFVVFENCPNLIAHLPVLPIDPINVEDVYTKGDDHDYDALRYGFMSRPRSSLFDTDKTFFRAWAPADKVLGY